MGVSCHLYRLPWAQAAVNLLEKFRLSDLQLPDFGSIPSLERVLALLLGYLLVNLGQFFFKWKILRRLAVSLPTFHLRIVLLQLVCTKFHPSFKGKR